MQRPVEIRHGSDDTPITANERQAFFDKIPAFTADCKDATRSVSGLSVIPNLDVIRPGNAEETAGAFLAAMGHTDGPTALILSG